MKTKQAIGKLLKGDAAQDEDPRSTLVGWVRYASGQVPGTDSEALGVPEN